MRKILSIFLTAVMTVSLFAVVPFSAGATVSSLDESYVDFDGDSAKYYADNTNYRAHTDDVQFVDLNDGHGNTVKFTKMSASTNKHPAAIRLSTTDGNGAFHVKAGETYLMSLDYKLVRADDALAIALKFIAEDKGLNAPNSLEDVAEAIPGYNKWYFWMYNNNDGTWRTASKEFTAPCDGTVVLVPFNDSDKVTVDSQWAEEHYGAGAGKALVNQEYYLDNIKLKKMVSHYTYVDFDGDSAKYYADNDGNFNANFYTKLVDSGDEHKKVVEFDQMSDFNGNSWPEAIAISNYEGTGRFEVKQGETYEISFDYRNIKADDALQIAAIFVDKSVPANGGGSANTANNEGRYAYVCWADPNQKEWAKKTEKITAPCDGTILLVPVTWRGSDIKGQQIQLDNIRVSRMTDVTLHNGALGDQTVNVAADTDLSDIKITAPAGAKFRQWYADAALTQPVSGKVGMQYTDLYAAFESIIGDFEDDGYVAAKDGWDLTDFRIEQYAGTTNSKALTNNGQEVISNSSYPPIIKLINSDGSDFTTVSGHTYKLSFDLKPVDSANLDPNSKVIVMKGQSKADGAPDFDKYTKPGTTDPTEASIYYSYGDSVEADRSYYNTYNFTFKGTGDKVFIASYSAGTYVCFDNIRIIDETAQNVINDNIGIELARGYAGETVKIHDANDADFVYYEDEKGTPVDTTTVIGQTKVLTKVNSQIAVTKSSAKNNILSFTTRFGGMGYDVSGNDVTVKTITVGNTIYTVEDIGLLVARAHIFDYNDDLLTLDNINTSTQGEYKISASAKNLKYSVQNNGVLEMTADITLDDFNRDYIVVGYVKCKGGKVIYSKMRKSIARYYSAAAGIETLDNRDHTRTINGKTYTLDSNSEFSSAESLSNSWNEWGNVSTKDKTAADGTVITKDYYNYYSTDSATYVENGNLVLDLYRTSETTYDAPELLSSTDFFVNGYLEVKARYDNIQDLGGAIWLNSVAISDNQLNIKPTSTDTHVKPEIDILEFNKITNFFATLHSWGTKDGVFGNKQQIRLKDPTQNNSDEPTLDLQNDHVFGLERTTDAIRIYVDGTKHFELTKQDAINKRNDLKWPLNDRTDNEIEALFVNPMYIILGMDGAMSGLQVGEHAKGYIDYVRIYK